MEKNYIFDVEAEAANGIPHTTNIAGTVVKQSHRWIILNQIENNQKWKTKIWETEREGERLPESPAEEARTVKFLDGLQLRRCLRWNRREEGDADRNGSVLVEETNGGASIAGSECSASVQYSSFARVERVGTESGRINWPVSLVFYWPVS